MHIGNATALTHFCYEQIDSRRQAVKVLIARGSYRIESDGRLSKAEVNTPLTLTDEYYGDPKSSSIRTATDIYYFKPSTDIYFVDPVAHSLNGVPQREWEVAVSIGCVSVRFTVSGRRYWKRLPLGRWKLSSSEPCTSVDLRFENAFGGICESAEGEQVHPENPVGKGGIRSERLKELDLIEAPQIYLQEDPPTSPNSRCSVVGLTPIAPWWRPRSGYVGTYDEKWVSESWPYYPENFDETFFCVAPKALQYPTYVQGGERVNLDGLSPDGAISFLIPKFRLQSQVFLLNGDSHSRTLVLDTIAIDVNRMVVDLTWRTSFLCPGRAFYLHLQEVV